MEPVRCYACGFPISNIKEAFDLMRQFYLEDMRKKNPDHQVHVDYNMMHPFQDANLDEIFKALGVGEKKYCCKTRLVSNVQFHDLEVQDRL